MKLRYEVPYVIWANYDIDAESGKDTSANYLAADVLHYAGISENAYWFLSVGITTELSSYLCNACAHERWSGYKFIQLKQELKDYQSLQYYQLFDWKKE